MKVESQFGGLTEQETARALGITRVTMRKVFKTALAKVRERLTWSDEQLRDFIRRERPGVK